MILGLGGGLLMLAGTLIATLLALSEARPDLTTLESVGAAPRIRRSVAASYALVVGGVGALLGAAIGLVPGIAISYPLTSTTWLGEQRPPGVPDHFLEIPWLLIGALVVALPVITAAVVWTTTRNRAPLTARLD